MVSLRKKSTKFIQITHNYPHYSKNTQSTHKSSPSKRLSVLYSVSQPVFPISFMHFEYSGAFLFLFILKFLFLLRLFPKLSIFYCIIFVLRLTTFNQVALPTAPHLITAVEPNRKDNWLAVGSH